MQAQSENTEDAEVDCVADSFAECDLKETAGFRSHIELQPSHLLFVPTLMHHRELCWQPAGHLSGIVSTADDGRQYLAGHTSTAKLLNVFQYVTLAASV